MVEDVYDVEAEFKFDASVFSLVDSVPQVRLSGGSYQKELVWHLMPTKPIEETTLAAVVRGGTVVQAASVQVKVI